MAVGRLSLASGKSYWPASISQGTLLVVLAGWHSTGRALTGRAGRLASLLVVIDSVVSNWVRFRLHHAQRHEHTLSYTLVVIESHIAALDWRSLCQHSD